MNYVSFVQNIRQSRMGASTEKVNCANEGNAILDYNGSVEYDEWAGLSGGPVMDDQCHVAGMLIRVSEPANTVIAVPMSRIVKFIDTAITFEETK